MKLTKSKPKVTAEAELEKKKTKGLFGTFAAARFA
jgi:hypothetical protein